MKFIVPTLEFSALQATPPVWHYASDRAALIKIYCSQEIIAAPRGANKAESISFDAAFGRYLLCGHYLCYKASRDAPTHTAISRKQIPKRNFIYVSSI